MSEMKENMGDDEIFWSWEWLYFQGVILTVKLTDIWKAPTNLYN